MGFLIAHEELTRKIQRRPSRRLAGRGAPVDKTLLTVVTLLLLAGLVALFSATYYQAVDQGDALLEVKRQLVGIGLGLLLMGITSRIPYRFWQQPKIVILGLAVSFAFLLLVLIPGIGVFRSSRRWLSIAGLSFQPSELARWPR